MIKVNLRGRLGNQLFQYAFAYSLGKRFGKKIGLFPTNHKNQIKQYFELPSDNTPVVVYDFRYYFFQTRRLFHKYLKLPTIPKTFIVPNKIVMDNISITNHFIQGYFQSERYFKNYEENIKKEFKIKNEWKLLFKTRYSYLEKKKYAAIHFRIGDYKNFQIPEFGIKSAILPISYYQDAIKTFSDQLDYILMVTDDPKFVDKTFNHLPNMKIVSDAEIIDFQLILNADFCVIANSTFSWWAAYLNPKPDKVVIAPKYWLGYNHKVEYPTGIMTDKFNWI